MIFYYLVKYTSLLILPRVVIDDNVMIIVSLVLTKQWSLDGIFSFPRLVDL